MRYIIEDKKYRFKSAFDTETGAYVRTGVLDENGKDTGKDPFMASYPHLIDPHTKQTGTYPENRPHKLVLHKAT